MNRLYGSILDSVEKQCYKSNEFIFGGYSSLEKKYRIWKFRFDNSGVKLFTTSPGIKTMLGKKIGPYIVAGDKKKEFKQKLHYFMRDKYGGSFENYSNNGFDTEPLEVLVGMLNESGIEDTIGGAPQIMKVYSFSQANPIGVYWPYKTKDKRDNRYIMGREVRKEEIIDYRFLNLKTMKTTKTSN